jgi:hypothetical protein
MLARIAQHFLGKEEVEHFLGKEEVTGSRSIRLIGSSIFTPLIAIIDGMLFELRLAVKNQ